MSELTQEEAKLLIFIKDSDVLAGDMTWLNDVSQKLMTDGSIFCSPIYHRWLISHDAVAALFKRAAVMTLNDYQAQAAETDIFPPDVALPAAIMGLSNEVGELAGKYKKVLRGDKTPPEAREAMLAEAGDILWYLAKLARALDTSLDEIASANLAKLADRQARNVIQGDGDNR